MVEDNQIVEQLDFQKEGIKLTKNSRGYNWELKILAIDKLSKEDIKRLEDLNMEMESKFNVGALE